jgi:hypothetical protein
MAQDNSEKPAVKTTIVGGRPPGSGKGVDTVPRGIEILLKKAAIDESFRKTLLSNRSNAADAIGLTLNPVEISMLKAMPEPALEKMIGATKVQPKIRQAFMGYTAAVMLAALTAASDGLPQDRAQVSLGIQPDAIQDQGPYGGGVRPDLPPSAPGGIRPDIVTPPAAGGIRADVVPVPSERQTADAYMKIAPRDELAPRGNLEVTIDNWTSPGAGGVLKIRLTKIESPAPSENNRTEGLGYARRGYFMQEDLPVGEYRVEIGFADSAFVRSKTVTVEHAETAKVSFKVKYRNPNDYRAPGQFATDGISIDIE